MNSKALENREKVQEIKVNFHTGRISYEEAKAQLAPIIEELNATSKVIAKKYNKRPTTFNFATLMR